MDKNVEKERLLREIKYYTSRIENFNKQTKSQLFLDSSDSEDDYPTFRTPGPLIPELKTTESGLETSLQATQELTNLTVLEYKTNVMVDLPKIKRGKPITEPGTWRDVTAECRIDVIPFSINFCTYQGTKKFAPVLYRNLSVLPVKKVHEDELSHSVLPDVTRPSDAFEVLKSYALAFRSRRTSLARLANQYTNIELEPAAEGGYLLKCGSVLAITWRLENKWTPLTPFHHKMKFDLDYMEEDQLKIIKQAHKKISDPTITTDERTLLLAKIISTCLELKATQDESMESEAESTKKADRTIIEDEPDDNLIIEHVNKNNLSKNDVINEDGTNIEGDKDIRSVNVEKEREKEIMAPPSSLPKKAKPKGKENKVDNRKSVKRAADGTAAVAKKAKTVENNSEQVTNEIEVTNDRNSKDLQNKQKPIDNQVNEIGKNTKKSNKNDDNITETQNDEARNEKSRPNTAASSKQNAKKPVKSSKHDDNVTENQNDKAKNDKTRHKTAANSNQNANKPVKSSKNDENVTENQNHLGKNDKTRPNSAGNSKQNDNKPVKNKISVQNEGSQPKKAKIDKNQVTVKNVNKKQVQKSNVVNNINGNKQNEDKVSKNPQTGSTKQPTNLNKQKNKQIVAKNDAKSSVKTNNQVKTITDKPTESTTDEKNTKTTTATGKTTKPTTVTEKPTKSNPNEVKNSETLPKTDSKNNKIVKNSTAGPNTQKSTEHLQKTSIKQGNVGKTIKNNKNSKASNIPKNNFNAKNIKKVDKSNPNDLKKQTLSKNSNVAIAKTVNRPKLTIKSHSNPSTMKTAGNIGDKNPKNIVKKCIVSKIPQKKFMTSTPVDFMWVSPRNPPSTSETNSVNTNIPRLLKKPLPKVNSNRK